MLEETCTKKKNIINIGKRRKTPNESEQVKKIRILIVLENSHVKGNHSFT